MTYEAHIVQREGHMEDGEHVSDRVVAVAIELETGVSAEGEAADDEEAIRVAQENLGRTIVAKRRAAEEAKLRETEDPAARALRLEGIIRDKGWDKVEADG